MRTAEQPSWPNVALQCVPTVDRAHELASLIRKAVFGPKASDGWCDLKKICSVGRFFPRLTSFRGAAEPHDALLIPRKDGSFVVPVDPVPRHLDGINWEIARHRNRFRVAHEIGHSFFYDRDSAPPRRLLKASEEEERFCDEFAAELLIPLTAVRRRGVTPHDIFSIHSEYEVSVEAAARAVSRAHSGLSVTGIMWGPARRAKESALRVVWCAGPRFVPLGARLNSDAVNRANLTGNSCQVEDLQIAGLVGRFQIQAGKLPRRKQLVAVLQPVSSVASDINVPSNDLATDRLPLE